MTSKTWFLPPDFTFLPDGQIALGSIIPSPRQPTATLASAISYPTIILPKTKSITEKNLSFSAEKSRSLGLALFAKLLDVGNAKVDVSWYKNKTFSAVDHEVRTYHGAFAPETLRAILALEDIQKHIDSGRFGKRHVYIITGLRVVRQSFIVTEEKGIKTATSVGVSGFVPTGTVPAVLGATIAGKIDDRARNSYETAPGIVFAYRLHVIRPKNTGADVELFSDRTAFFSGEAEDVEAEMEIVEVDGAVYREDLDAEQNDYEETRLEGADNDAYIVFHS
ncbi:hypothetical protein TGAM01_v209569 [Trichoderma gamsii]|uniref:Uncharacterized protein n=1 Tax=Trichoderma gamsii TaxID=398673 RepID=A0A2P4ZB61_9HYPO|nr:hypothetical protein TGAM01_v209569 [Trichoderma gamsii]PON21538.1 hypothetical protein TGAM01_v209569 [Trichoderma gamsii]